MQISQALISRGMVSEQDFMAAQSKGGDVIATLVSSGVVEHQAAMDVLADEAGVEYVDLTKVEVDLSLLGLFPQKIVYRHILFPVSRTEDSLTIATADPMDYYPLDEISSATGLAIVPVLADRSEIAKLIKTHLGVGGETIEGLIEQKMDAGGIELLDAIETDGSELSVKGREVDVRVSVIPMIHGEGLVMRILDKGKMKFELKSLGMSESTYDVFSKLIKLPHGIILVTGPTGSGKTTTLYSSLIEINDPTTKIITTEDPVEYQLPGINQIQVHPKIGLTFSHSLRSILRHDPDVVLVGEIRDLETAENAIQASLTGHLVFSTLHTNDAAGAFTRMGDMGVEPFLVASTVEAIMAQRLVRRLCPDCCTPVSQDQLDLPEDFPHDMFEGQTIYGAVGCRQCRNVGYRGRLGIYELLVTTDELRQLAQEGKSTWEIKKAAIASGMKTLRDDGWNKVLEGKTSVDEVLRITKGDRRK